MTFTEDQIEAIEQLAAVNYTVKQIAMYLGIDASLFQNEFEDKESQFRYSYDRGKLIAQAKIDIQLLSSAQGGNITAMQQYEKIKASRHFENIRDQIIDGH